MKLSDVSIKLIRITAVASAAAGVIGCVFLENRIGFLAGIAAGIVLAGVKVALIERSAIVAMSLPKEKAGKYLQRQFIVRYGLNVAVFAAALLLSIETFYGAAATVLCLQLAGYLVRFFIKSETPAQKGETDE